MPEAIRVEGQTRLRVTLARASRDLEEMNAAASAAGRAIAGIAKGRAPRITGRLAASVTSSIDGGDFDVHSPLEYARRVQVGYRRYNQRAQPFISSTVRDNEKRILDTYTREADEILGRVEGV